MTEHLRWRRRSGEICALQYQAARDEKLIETLGSAWRTVSGMETAGWVRLPEGWVQVEQGDFVILETEAVTAELIPVAVCNAGLFLALYEQA